MTEIPLSPDWHLWSADEQLLWVEQLSANDLRDWLRAFVWTQTTAPLVAPQTSTPSTHLSNILRRGGPALFVRVRTVVPVLLQEWGWDDPKSCLEDLLFLCSSLRCASAEDTVAQIATERLTGRLDEVELRQNCVGVLSGFGCTERTEHLFRRYIGDINYSALCYRALYRYDLSNAVRELPTLISAHVTARVTPKLRPVLNILLFHHLRDQRPRFWRDILKLTRPQTLEVMLQVLQSLGIVLAVPFKTSGPQEVEVLYGHSSEGTFEASDKIDTADISNETVIVITHTLERYLRSSNRLGSAIMSGAAQ